MGESGVPSAAAVQSRAIGLDVAGAEPRQGQQLALDVDLDQVELRGLLDLADPEGQARVVPGGRVVDVVEQVGHELVEVGEERRRPVEQLSCVVAVPGADVGVVAAEVVEVVLDARGRGVEVDLPRAEADVERALLRLVVPLREEVRGAEGRRQGQAGRAPGAEREDGAEPRRRKPEAHVSHGVVVQSRSAPQYGLPGTGRPVQRLHVPRGLSAGAPTVLAHGRPSLPHALALPGPDRLGGRTTGGGAP